MAAPLLTQRERRVSIDSSAYLALLDRRDEHHTAAVAILEQLVQTRFRPYTTNVVVIEAHALILSTMGRTVATQFVRDLERGSTTIIRARASDETHARTIIYRYSGKAFSYTDAIRFVVMERLGMSRAFTFDDDFTQDGLTVLTPDRF